MTATMRAVIADACTGPSGLRLREVPEPDATGKVLIDVTAAGVSFPDLLATHGKHQRMPAPPFTPGLDIAGIVRSAPPECGVEAGQRVMAFCTGFGGFSDTVATDPCNVLPAPAGFDADQAASFILNYSTAYFALTRRTRVEPDETIMVTGAAGGLGTAAVQIATALGCRVLAVASSEGKRAAALAAGAVMAMPPDNLLETVLAETGGRGVDVVVELVGGSSFDQSLRCLAAGGRLLTLGFAGGEVPTVGANRLLLRNISVVGVAWGPTVVDGPERETFFRDLLQLAATNDRVRPAVSRRLPLPEAALALRMLEDRAVTGRLVLHCADKGGWN